MKRCDGPDEIAARKRLVIFSDDWGRHHSSAQCLAREWLDRFDVDWIETIGTRRPRLSRADLGRGVEKLKSWFTDSGGRDRIGTEGTQGELRIHSPAMWPSFASRAGSKLNTRQMRRTLVGILANGPRPTAILSTVPIVSELVTDFPGQRWIYYCVDALHDWSELDSRTLEFMERDLVQRCDAIVAASKSLGDRVASIDSAAAPVIVTHGVETERWRLPSGCTPDSNRVALFFGAVDERIDVDACRQLARGSRLVMVGPAGRAPRGLAGSQGIELRGPARWEELPAIAATADALVLPYLVDSTTAHLEPLKLKEYLATNRPVIASALPAVERWSGALDIAQSPDDFSRLFELRAESGVPADQLERRSLLDHERWSTKAAAFERVFDELASRPTTVLHVRSCGGPGSGPEKTILRSHVHAAAHGYRVITAFLRDPADTAFANVVTEASALCAPVHLIDDSGPFDRSIVPALRTLIEDERVAVFHGHDAKSNLLGRRIRNHIDVALVSTAHGWVHRARKTPLYDRVDRWTLRSYARVIAVSSNTRDHLVSSGVESARVSLITNGVEVTEELPARNHIREPLTLGAVGRLEAEKGFDQMIRAVGQLTADGHDVRLKIYGDGSQRDRLAALASDLGLSARVELLGFEPDRAKIFASFGIFVLSSLREGTPNALLEAMSLAVPIIAARVGGVEDLVTDGVEAELIESNAPASIADAVKRLLASPETAERMRRAAHERARVDHAFETRMQRVCEVYAEALR